MKDAVSKLHNFYVANNMGEMNQVVGEVLDEIARLRAEAEENKVVLDLCGNTERHLRDKAAGLFMEGEKKDGQIAALTAQLELTKGLQPNYFHDSHKAVDAFWKVWNEVGEPHKHGVYESTWMALRAAIEAIEDTNND